MEKGQTCKIEITDLSTEGKGIGKASGMAVFVAETVIGDIAEVEITKVKKNYAFGRLVQLLEPSEMRVQPPCEYAAECGGCPLQAMSYEGQLAWKHQMIGERLRRLGGIEEPKVLPVVGMDTPFRYRNKAQMPISCGGTITKKGGIVVNAGPCSIGFYKAKSHEVVNCRKCLIQAETAECLAQALREFMEADHITAWDPKWEKGLMRHLVVKTAFATGEVMAILVVNGKGIPNSDKLVEMMDAAINAMPEREDGIAYSLESVVLNVNTKKSSEILGEKCITLAGNPVISEKIGGLTFEISPLSFYQVNSQQMVKLYDKVLEYAGLTGEEIVFDLYCGVGAIGLYCATKAKRVIGIESVKAAVLNANRNAVVNGIVNAEFICGRVEDELPKLVAGSAGALEDAPEVSDAEDVTSVSPDAAEIPGVSSDAAAEPDAEEVPGVSPDVVILDPPRAGCYPGLIESVVEAEPERIVYVSCDPATMARDVKEICGRGYEFKEAAPVDMFGQSVHVECVVLMSRVDK